MIVNNRGHTRIRNIGDVPVQVEPKRGALGYNFLFNALFDCLQQVNVHLLEGETAAGKMVHLRSETNEKSANSGGCFQFGKSTDPASIRANRSSLNSLIDSLRIAFRIEKAVSGYRRHFLCGPIPI